MIVRWTTEEGVEVKLDFDYGVCEKVQVGTKVEEQYDPEALDAVPKVEVEVPVYEYMCPDPLRA